MTRRDRLAVLAIGLWLFALLAYRAAYVEPRAWGAICAQAGAPLACLPRAALLWLQQYELWGGIALVLGLAAFIGTPVAALAVAAGVAGVVNHNASWGMLGACLGGWAWITRGSAPSAAAARN